MMDANDFQLPPNILKNLVDKNDERREVACKQLQIIVRKNADKKHLNQIQKIVTYFKEKYFKSFDLSKKIAGLQAFPSIITGILNFQEGIQRFAAVIVNTILQCLNDSQNKVRWTALKSLYYISKSLDDKIIKMFNLIFEKIIGKITDLDQVVKNAASFLDKSLQTILSSALSSSEGCSDFNLQEFMGIVKSKLKSMNPGVREFLIKWISTLNQLMSVDLLIYLPDLLEDLLFMLGDKEKNLRSSAEECLANFMAEMDTKFNQHKLELILSEEIINRIVTILIKVAKGKLPTYTKLNTLIWFNRTIFVFFKAQIEIKVPKPSQKLYFKKIIIERFDQVLQPILLLMSHEEEEVRRAALTANDMLMQNIQMINRQETINFSKVMPLLKEMLSQKKSSSTSESALKWMKFMLQNYNDKILPEINDIIEKLAEKLCDSNVKNVISIIENTTVRQEYFQLLIEKMLMLLLNKSPNDSEERFQQILRKFSVILQPDKFCRSICSQLTRTFDDKKFIFQIVHYLNILIINQKSFNMSKIRRKLQSCSQGDHTQFFMILFNAFKYNPSAVTSLCLMAQQYQLAYKILLTFGNEFQIDGKMLMGFCKLASLIQSPGFLFLRLQILQKSDPYLLEALTSLLMILPQGKIFSMLKNRLDVSKILPHRMKKQQKIKQKMKMSEGGQINVEQCLQQYRIAQSASQR